MSSAMQSRKTVKGPTHISGVFVSSSSGWVSGHELAGLNLVDIRTWTCMDKDEYGYGGKGIYPVCGNGKQRLRFVQVLEQIQAQVQTGTSTCNITVTLVMEDTRTRQRNDKQAQITRAKELHRSLSRP